MAYNGEEVLIGDSVLTLTNKLNEAIRELKRVSTIVEQLETGIILTVGDVKYKLEVDENGAIITTKVV